MPNSPRPPNGMICSFSEEVFCEGIGEVKKTCRLAAEGSG
jgi:hypothetical protein